MARPRVSNQLTTTTVARELGMNIGKLIRWVERGALPPASRVDRNGVRYFDHDWLEKAREVLNIIKRG